MKRFWLVFTFLCGTGVGFLASGERPERKTGHSPPPESLTVVYPLREVTHPGTGQESVVFRTVTLTPGDHAPGRPAWTVTSGDGYRRYVPVED